MKFVFLLCFSTTFVFTFAQKNLENDIKAPKPYCFAEINTIDLLDENTSSKLRKDLSERYSVIKIFIDIQRIQIQICSKIDLKIEDKILRDILKKYKLNIQHVFYSFEPIGTKETCEYPECE